MPALKPLETIIESETSWSPQTLETYARSRRVSMKRAGNLAILNYDDDLPNDRWDDFNLQCRGVILDLVAKRVLAHPFDKFFNLGRHPTAMSETLPFDSGYEATVKYDGSMVVAYAHTAGLRFATRFSFDNLQTREALSVAEARYPQLARIDFGRFTPVFELISPVSRVLVDYGEPDLVLIGVRDLDAGQMLDGQSLDRFAESHGLRPAERVEAKFEELAEQARTGELDALEEGWVVRFGTGQMVKVKTWQYFARRRIDQLNLDLRSLAVGYCTKSPAEWSAFVDRLPELVQEPVRALEARIEALLQEMADEIASECARLDEHEDPKAFAAAVGQAVAPELRPLYFRQRKGGSVIELIRQRAKLLLPIDRLGPEPVSDALMARCLE